MEHLLHLAICIVFLLFWGQRIGGGRHPHFAWLGVISLVLVSTRFEGLFLAGFGAAALLFLRQLRAGLAVLSGALAPLVLHGALATLAGGYWLPNSVMLKTKAGQGLAALDPTRLIGHLAEAWYVTPLLLVLVGALLVEYRARKFAPSVACGLLTLATALAHLQFADVGWFFRYDAYLVGLASLYCLILLTEKGGWQSRLDELGLPRFAGILVASALVVIGLGARSSASLQMTVPATTHIHLQQVQMGHFVEQFYAGKVVAANDVGAISYFGKAPVLDLWGLGHNEVAHTKLANQYGPQTMATIASKNDVAIAIVYEEAFEPYGGLPPRWKAVGRWSIKNRQPLSLDVVTFFAVGPDERQRLGDNLRIFELPPEVTLELL